MPLTEQDQRVLTMVIEAGRALVLAFNKWDLVDEDRRYLLDKEIDRELAQVQWAPRVNISATDRAGGAEAGAAHRSPRWRSWDARVPTGRLNTFFKEIVAATPPPVRGGKQPRSCSPPRRPRAHRRSCCSRSGFLEAGYRRFLRAPAASRPSDSRAARSGINVRVREKRSARK